MKRRTDGKVPLLVTMDLEVAPDHDLGRQDQILAELARDLAAIGLPVTVFSATDAAVLFASRIAELAASGHEIACHGLTHSTTEHYGRMSQPEIRRAITESTRRLGTIAKRRPRCFRGPSMTTSSATQQVLIDNGYVADFSVCSQRLDILNSKGGHPRWLIAPRRPYRPSARSPYKKGNLPIFVVPLSGFGAPFLSGMLYIFGVRFMKMFFRALFEEARHSKAPIVYLFHSYEFTDYLGKTEEASSRNDVARQKILHRLYVQNRAWRYSATFALLTHMASYRCVRPMTGREYVASLANLAHRGGLECSRF
jgi:hypothetical protein